MSILSNPSNLVKLLREHNASTDPRFHCECGKFCPRANACLPRRGEIHQPYYTLREHNGARGRSWTVITYDPQEDRIYPLAGQVHASPCTAAMQAARLSGRTQHPVNLMAAAKFCPTPISWEALEEKTAQALYDYGRQLFADNPKARSFDHPLIDLGFNDAQEETRQAGYVWQLPVKEVAHA